jgi:hypothetical protein
MPQGFRVENSASCHWRDSPGKLQVPIETFRADAGEFARVKIMGHTDCDLIAEPVAK